MDKYRLIAKTSGRRTDVLDDPQPNKRTRFTDQERETLGLLGLVPDTAEDIDQQLEWVLDQLKGKSTDLERYVYLIRLCDRNETLFFKVLMSRSLRFLLGSNCLTSLVEIALHLPSFARYLRSSLSQEELRSCAGHAPLS